MVLFQKTKSGSVLPGCLDQSDSCFSETFLFFTNKWALRMIYIRKDSSQHTCSRPFIPTCMCCPCIIYRCNQGLCSNICIRVYNTFHWLAPPCVCCIVLLISIVSHCIHIYCIRRHLFCYHITPYFRICTSNWTCNLSFGDRYVFPVETLDIFCESVLLSETATLTMSIVKNMYQFAYIDSDPTSSMFQIVYLQQNLAFLINWLN